MARKVRVFVQNSSQHIKLSSLNGMSIFEDSSDYEVFLEMLEELNLTHNLDIHAYIVMQNYFEFLATPRDAESISKFMQSLGRKYVGYFNKKYGRTGTLWDGRYKSSLVEDTFYLFDIMRYIESKNTKEYLYSSIGKNLFNRADKIVTQHNLYKGLAYTDEHRKELYERILDTEIDTKKDEFITSSLDKQQVTASKEFIAELEEKMGIALSSKSVGRPKKQQQTQGKKMYKNLVVLDKTQHAEHKLNQLSDMAFAKDVAIVPLVINESALVATDLPVVFSAGDKQSLIAIASLGGGCLTINEQNKWTTPYIPIYFKKYPFSMARTKEDEGQRVILIDEDSPAISKSKGKKLFKKNGDKSDVLQAMVDMLVSAENDALTTQNIVDAISASGILEDMEISLGEGDEKKVLVNNFLVVNRDKLNALSDDILADWVRRGIMNFIEIHIKSLENIQKLFDIAHQRQN